MKSDIVFEKIEETDEVHWYNYRLSADGRERLTNALRKVIDRVSMTAASAEALEEITQGLEGIAEKLEGIPKRKSRDEFFESISEADVCSFLAFDPILGKLNPLAPPLEISVEGQVAVGKVNFGIAYEGAHGHVHGGFIAGAFDDVLGCAEAFSGMPGVTGSISVRYLAPTPLHTDLRFEGRFDHVEGRKIFTKGKLYAGDTCTAEATGIYISLAGL